MRKEKLFMKKISILLMRVFALIVSCGNNKAQKNSGLFIPIQSNAAGTLSVILSEENDDAPSEIDAPSKNEKIIEIKEKMFIAQTNDVYLMRRIIWERRLNWKGFLSMINTTMQIIVLCFVMGRVVAAATEMWDLRLPGTNPQIKLTLPTMIG
jgi:hypothetical protein